MHTHKDSPDKDDTPPTFPFWRHLILLVALPFLLGLGTTFVKLIEAFDEVARAAPENKTALLTQRIDESTTGVPWGMGLAALGIVVTFARRQHFEDRQKATPPER